MRIYVCISPYKHVCVIVCMCVHAFVPHTHTHTHTHAHTVRQNELVSCDRCRPQPCRQPLQMGLYRRPFPLPLKWGQGRGRRHLMVLMVLSLARFSCPLQRLATIIGVVFWGGGRTSERWWERVRGRRRREWSGGGGMGRRTGRLSSWEDRPFWLCGEDDGPSLPRPNLPEGVLGASGSWGLLGQILTSTSRARSLS